jgi:hypothetical protein
VPLEASKRIAFEMLWGVIAEPIESRFILPQPRYLCLQFLVLFEQLLDLGP